MKTKTEIIVLLTKKATNGTESFWISQYLLGCI
jgi:hypothetical protein